MLWNGLFIAFLFGAGLGGHDAVTAIQIVAVGFIVGMFVITGLMYTQTP